MFFFTRSLVIQIHHLMTFFLRVLVILFALFFLVFSQENPNPHVLPRPLIVQNDENMDTLLKESIKVDQNMENLSKESLKIQMIDTSVEDEVVLQCTSWRFAAEANNLNPWKTIPEECRNYVKEYMKGKGYIVDLERVSKEAIIYAKNVEIGGDGMDIWVFDVDETLLSNLPYYEQHGYGSELFDPEEFDKWVQKALAPAIQPSLELYKEVLELGFKVFLLTGRNEKFRTITIQNLINAGYHKWDKLILRASNDHGKLAVIFKSEKRNEMVYEGYRIIGNSGDQWSDLIGSSMSVRSFKLPNPMYYIP